MATTSIDGVRKLVTRRYRYLIYYTLDDARDELVVLSIRHPKRQRQLREG